MSRILRLALAGAFVAPLLVAGPAAADEASCVGLRPMYCPSPCVSYYRVAPTLHLCGPSLTA